MNTLAACIWSALKGAAFAIGAGLLLLLIARHVSAQEVNLEAPYTSSETFRTDTTSAASPTDDLRRVIQYAMDKLGTDKVTSEVLAEVVELQTQQDVYIAECMDRSLDSETEELSALEQSMRDERDLHAEQRPHDISGDANRTYNIAMAMIQRNMLRYTLADRCREEWWSKLKDAS